MQIIMLGALAIIIPVGLRVWFYQSANRAVALVEQRIGKGEGEYKPVDYFAMSTAAPIVYSDQDLQEAENGGGVLAELGDIGSAGEDYEEFLLEESGTDEAETAYILEIPAISLKTIARRSKSFADIYAQMRLGAAIFPKAPALDQIGNLCMSAHRTGTRDYFRNLDKLSAGDKVFIHSQTLGSFCYEVEDVGIIAANDWSVTEETDVPVVTLLSCQAYKGVSHGQRIMVRAKLVARAAA